jgi:APA family basic amino acid/polyamine antiporter
VKGTDVADAQPTEARKYGYWAGHFVVVASMIGAGILTISGFTLNATGNPGALLGLWVLGGVLALCGAVTVAELATALPRSGGDYVFVGEAYGPGAAFVSGWATFVIGFAAPTAVVSHLALKYLVAPFKSQLTEWHADGPKWAILIGANALVLGVAAIHSLGAKESTRFQVATTLIKISILVGIAVAGLLFGKGDWNHLSASHQPTGGEWAALAIGLIYVGYAYAGWNGASYLAGEIREPARLLPRVMVFGTLTVLALYLLVNLTYVYALDPVAMKEVSFPDFSEVGRFAVEKMFGENASNVFAVVVGLSLVASVSAYVLTGPRVAFAMARGGAFPGYAGRLHPTRQTPIAATWTQAAISVGLITTGTFEQLLNYTSVGLAVAASLTILSIFPIRRRADLPHPYKMPLYPLPPILFLLLTAWSVGYTVYDELVKKGELQMPGPATYSLLTILVAIPISLVIPAGRKTGPTTSEGS